MRLWAHHKDRKKGRQGVLRSDINKETIGCFYLFRNIERIKLGIKCVWFDRLVHVDQLRAFRICEKCRCWKHKIDHQQEDTVHEDNQAVFYCFYFTGLNRKLSTCYRAMSTNQESAGIVRFEGYVEQGSASFVLPYTTIHWSTTFRCRVREQLK